MIHQKLQLLNTVVTKEIDKMPNLSIEKHWFFCVIFGAIPPLRLEDEAYYSLCQQNVFYLHNIVIIRLLTKSSNGSQNSFLLHSAAIYTSITHCNVYNIGKAFISN